MRREIRLNDREREMWVNNDEGLYNWFRSSRLSMREFLRQNRAEIDAAITGVLGPQEPSPRMSRRELELHRAKHWTTSMNPARDPYAYRQPKVRRGASWQEILDEVFNKQNILFWKGTPWLEMPMAQSVGGWIDTNSGYGTDIVRTLDELYRYMAGAPDIKVKIAREYSPVIYLKSRQARTRYHFAQVMFEFLLKAKRARRIQVDEVDLFERPSLPMSARPLTAKDYPIVRLWWD